MSDLLEEREKAIENKFARDEEQRFIASSKAIRLLGLWAADQLGCKDESAIKYADKISDLYLEKSGLHGVALYIKDSFMAKGLEISEERLESLFKRYQERVRGTLDES